MNRKILAVVIPALLATGAANAAEIYNANGNKVDFYGKLEATMKDVKSNTGDVYARFGVMGETQISEQLTGYGQFELQFNANNNEKENEGFTRLAFAGLKFADYGSLDFGRNKGVVNDIAAWTDSLPKFGGELGGADKAMTNRTSNVLTYRNANFFGLVDGLNMAVQYQAKAGENDEGVATSMTYDTGMGINLGAAYSKANISDKLRAKGTYKGAGKHAEVWNVAAKYDANNIYVAAMFAETRNIEVEKTQNIEFTAQYNYDFGLTPEISYLQTKGDVSDKYFHKYVSVGASYKFNKNLKAIVDYKINLIDEDKAADSTVGTDDQIALGLIYTF